jgi:hypothetical protein
MEIKLATDRIYTMLSTVRQFHGTIGFWSLEEVALRQLQTIARSPGFQKIFQSKIGPDSNLVECAASKQPASR